MKFAMKITQLLPIFLMFMIKGVTSDPINDLSLLSETTSSSEQLVKGDHPIGNLDTTIIKTTVDCQCVEYDLPTNIKYDWKANDLAYYTLLNDEIVKGSVTDVTVYTVDNVYIAGFIVSPSKKQIGTFSAAYYAGIIVGDIFLWSTPGFVYNLKPADDNKSKKPTKMTYLMEKIDLSLLQPDGPGIVAAVTTKTLSTKSIAFTTTETAAVKVENSVVEPIKNLR